MCLFCVGVVGESVIVSDYCVIGSECTVKSNETLPPGTVISGTDCRRWNKQVNIKVMERERRERERRERGRERVCVANESKVCSKYRCTSYTERERWWVDWCKLILDNVYLGGGLEYILLELKTHVYHFYQEYYICYIISINCTSY